MKPTKRFQNLIQLLLVVGIILTINVLSSFFYTQFDITEDKRFTLSPATYRLLDEFKESVEIEVYLEGDFPSEYKRLQNTVTDILDKFHNYNSFIEYRLINPIPAGTTDSQKDTIERQLRIKSFPVSDGRQGSPIYYVYPAATIRFKGNREQTIYFVEPGDVQQNPATGTIDIRNMNSVINQLEYKFSNALKKVLYQARARVAILSGHGEVPMFIGFDTRGRRVANPNTYSFQQSIFRFYDYEPINLDSTLGIDSRFNVLIVPKPRREFGLKHQFMIDQYVMGGGKVIWMIDGTDMETDSLRNDGVHFLADITTDIGGMLFKYGARVNNNLIASWEAGALPDLVTGSYQIKTAQKWFYYPLVYPHLTPSEAKEQGRSTSMHPIVKDLDYVEMRYASSVDTVRTATEISKTVLLRSSKYSKLLYPPTTISFGAIDPQITPDAFQKGYQNVAVLLEGQFESYFKNKIDPAMQAAWEAKGKTIEILSKPTKMIVIGDGDMVVNDFPKNINRPAPLGLGYDPKSGPYLFGNETFLLNCMEYLLDDKNLMSARTKEIKLRPLDQERAMKEETKWQLINLVLPLVLLGIFGWLYFFIRRRRFGKQA